MLRSAILTALMSAGVFQQAPPAPTPAAPPPATDIYELFFDGGVDNLKRAKLRPVSVEPGYDNQPAFTPDHRAILFTANRDGKQTDIYELDRGTRRVRQLTSTPESEYSATIPSDAGAGTGDFTVIRVEADGTQRLWRFDRTGGTPRVVLNDIKPVGYHAWIDADQLALFVLGQPATLQHARVSTGKANVIASGIGRSLHRIPGTQNVSFIHREAADQIWVKEFNPASGAITALVRIPGKVEPDVAWLADGTLLMSAGPSIAAWKRGAEGWRDVFDASAHKLGPVTRMAAALDRKSLAIVVNEPRR
jgi:hypothetical protein